MLNIWDSILCFLTLFGLLKHSRNAFKWLIGMMVLDTLIIGVNFGCLYIYGTHPNKFLMSVYATEEVEGSVTPYFFLTLIHERFNIFLKDLYPYPNSFLAVILNIVIWYNLFWIVPSESAKRPAKKPKVTKPVAENPSHVNVDPSWLFHSCLYGHKDNLKRILDKSEKVDINPNLSSIDGETPMHLAILGNHLPIVQVLVSRYKKDLNLSLRNDQGMNVMDSAVAMKRMPILKLLLRYWKPEISTLILAIEDHQSEVIPQLMEKLKKYFTMELTVPIKRYMDLSKELESKNVSKERKAICQTNLEVYKKNIVSQLKKLSKLPVHHPVDDEEEHQQPKVQTNTEDLLSEFDCPVCFELMSSPKRIFSCSNDHYICSMCLTDPKISSCPQCREDFNVVKPHVRHTSEQILARLIQK